LNGKNIACVAGAKRAGRGAGRKARKRGKGREPSPLSGYVIHELITDRNGGTIT